ncbi:MAG: hypothetical protein ACJ8CC_12030 [Microvirga sp.]
MAILFEILRSGNDFSCKADGGAPFFVGRRVPYDGNIGLYNIFAKSKIERLNYNASDFAKQHEFWATFIEPTALCEGRNFLTLNTYDRAAFTFGFGQFAAHVPNGDFVKYFRAMLALPNADDYFPNIKLISNRICKVELPPAKPIQLESDTSTDELMKYLNPDLSEVQDAEVIAAAKFIHWTSQSVAARNAQVEEMILTFRSSMQAADKRVGIDGRTADQCCVIADILHQGRGGKMTWPLVDAALKSSKPFDNLIAIGAPKWDRRKKTLKEAINARPRMKTMKWSTAKGDFV